MTSGSPCAARHSRLPSGRTNASLALDALKRCPSAESIKLASSLVDDAQVRDRAVETAIFIGEKIKDNDPAAAAAAGEKALEASPPRELADRARALTH